MVAGWLVLRGVQSVTAVLEVSRVDVVMSCAAAGVVYCWLLLLCDVILFVSTER